jgi:hypothetical protein
MAKAIWPSAAIVFAFVLSQASASANDVACEAAQTLKVCDPADPDTLKSVCGCDLTRLKPLQTAVGMSEVNSKKSEIEKHPDKECGKLKDKPILVIVGPGGNLYITDHHHTAYAWLLVEQERHESSIKGICQIINRTKDLPLTFESEDKFWAALAEKRLVRRPPQSLAALADDPYRSLASLVEDRGGFCKTDREFAEFAWADFFRARLDVPITDAVADKLAANPCDPVVDGAIKLAHSSDAENLPGYSVAACKIDKQCPK